MSGDACAWYRADFYRRGRCWRCGRAALAAGAAGVDLPETVAEMLGYEDRPRVAPLEPGALGLRAVDRGRLEVEVRLDLVA